MENKNDLINELGQNFIEYAVAVNTDRAIPNSVDGLKPVHKRILWDAFESGYASNKKYVKCAAVVGDTIAKYHPHGDTAVYEALVRLSQPWALRYPLIDFHGNNGNIAGDGAAHYRYTECKLPKLVEDGMLQGLKKKNVEFGLNFSDELNEPTSLPAIFPNLLCNPNTGIGVAMACNWAPHNLTEVAQAIYDYIDGKEPMLPGPDFPTGGIIINKNDIPTIMKTGRGSVKVRGRYKVEKNNIVFYEIPYGTTIEALMNEIGESAENDISGIDNIRDESNKQGIRIVIECEKGVNPDSIAQKLYAKTNLQKSFSYNQVALVGKTPTELNLKQCIEIYLNHNIECLIREIKYDLTKAEARLEIVNGLLIALEDIDNIIAKIKISDSAAAAKEMLMKDYKMSEVQAKAVLDMKLSKLAKLEKVEIENEKKELLSTITELKSLLADKNKQILTIKERLQAIVKKYGDARRTELAQIEIPKEEKEIIEVVPEDCVVIATQTGDIKRIPKTSFKVQKRNGKGVKSEDDAILSMISTNTIDNLLIFTNKGKMYRLLVDLIPVGTNASKGTRIATLINLEPDEKPITITSLDRKTDKKYVIFITQNGLFKKTLLEEYTKVKRSTGIAAINLKEGDTIANVTFANEEDFLIITQEGMSIRFSSKEVAPIGRTTAGVKSIKMADGDKVIVGLPIINKTDMLAVFSTKGLGKKVILEEFPIQARAGKGVYVYKPTDSTGKVAGAVLVNDNDSILLTGKPNSICISATDIPVLGRAGIGNIIIKNDVQSVIKI